MALRFYVGLHQPSDAQHVTRASIHVQRLATRRKRWAMLSCGSRSRFHGWARGIQCYQQSMGLIGVGMLRAKLR